MATGRPGKWNQATMSYDMDENAMGVRTGYLSSVYWPNRFQEMIGKARKALDEIQKITPFDAIVFQGQSGSAIGYALGAITGIPMVNLRKNNDDSHHIREMMNRAEGCSNIELRYLIVDDFISSGATVERIWTDLKQYIAGAKCIGILTFAGAVREDRKDWRINCEWREDKALYVPVWHVCEKNFSRPVWQLNGPALRPKEVTPPAASKSQGEVMFEKAVEAAITSPGTQAFFADAARPPGVQTQEVNKTGFYDQLAVLADRLFTSPSKMSDEYLEGLAATYGVPKEYITDAAQSAVAGCFPKYVMPGCGCNYCKGTTAAYKEIMKQDPRDMIVAKEWPGFTPLPPRRPEPLSPEAPRTDTESPGQGG